MLPHILAEFAELTIHLEFGLYSTAGNGDVSCHSMGSSFCHIYAPA